MKKLLIFSLFLLGMLPQLSHSMNRGNLAPLSINPGLGHEIAVMAHQLEENLGLFRQHLTTRFGTAMANFVIQTAVRSMELKNKYFPVKPKPQFDPIKYLAVGTFKFINRNQLNIGLTSSTILTILMLYLSAKTWYEHSQEREKLNKQLLKVLETAKTTNAISNAYNQFPDYAKNSRLEAKIDAYESAINEYKKAKNQQNLEKVCSAFSQLWLALY